MKRDELEALFEPGVYETFQEQDYLVRPYSVPSRAHAFARLGRSGVFQSLIGKVPERDVLVVKDGKLSPDPIPRTKEDVEAAMERGFSIVLRNTDRLDEELGKFAECFERDFFAEAAIQLYATPARFHSFGWHYDAEEVFIFQTEGVKEYFLRENTVHPHPLLRAMPKDMQFEKETSPIIVCALIPGDWLYIPAGWWHVAKAAVSSISISVGVMAPAMIDCLPVFDPALLERAEWRRRVPLRQLRKARRYDLTQIPRRDGPFFDPIPHLRHEVSSRARARRDELDEPLVLENGRHAVVAGDSRRHSLLK